MSRAWVENKAKSQIEWCCYCDIMKYCRIYMGLCCRCSAEYNYQQWNTLKGFGETGEINNHREARKIPEDDVFSKRKCDLALINMDTFSGRVKEGSGRTLWLETLSVASLLRGTDIWSVKYESGLWPIMLQCQTKPSLTGGLAFLRSRVHGDNYGNLDFQSSFCDKHGSVTVTISNCLTGEQQPPLCTHRRSC